MKTAEEMKKYKAEWAKKNRANKPAGIIGRPKEPLYGVGINDADYNTQPMINGKKVWCKFASTWRDMIERCYSANFHEKYPSYKGTTVCEDWKYFSKFREWMEKQNFEGRQLDKDILGDGTHYSPETCRFITQQTNSVLTKVAKTGVMPLGVFFEKSSGKYKASCRIQGVLKYLGTFWDKQTAHKEWQKAKVHAIKLRIDSGEECAEIVAALHNRINILLLNISNNTETKQL